MSGRRALVCLALALVVPAPGPPAGAAEDAAAEPDALPRPSDHEERIEVRAAMPEVDDAAAFATVIDAEGIEGRGEDLADVLRRVPGARVRDYGGLGQYATVSLRGSTAEQVTVLVDGVPQNRALGGPVDLSAIPATQIERVTVFRGFGPASLGLGGIGGVVDVRTRAPSARPEGRLDVLAGELGTARLSTGWSLRAGARGALRIGAETLESAGDYRFLDTGGTLFDRGDDVVRHRRNNGVEHRSLLLQGTWREIGGGDLRVALRAQRRERGVPGVDNLPSATTRLDDDGDDLTASWSLRRDGVLRALDVMLDGFEQHVRFRDLAGELGIGAQDETTRLTGGGLAGLVRLAAGRHNVLLRWDVRRERAAVRDRALLLDDRGGAERDLAALTVEDLLTFGRLTLAPSARWEQRRDDFRAGADAVVPPPAADSREGRGSGKLGWALALGPRASLRGSLGRFHRSPSLLELFGDRGTVVGNPALRPERGLAAELGGRVALARAGWTVDVEAVAFGRRADDLILLIPNSQFTAVARNLAGADVYGLEGSWTARRAGWSVAGGGTLQRARDASGGPLDGRPLVYQPERLGYAGVAWSGSRVRARWDVTYVGENATDLLDTPALRMPARVIHDATLAYRWPTGLALGVDVRNLFDRRTRDVARFPLPDRVLLVHVGWSPAEGRR